MRCLLLGNELIDGDRVPCNWPRLSTSQPHRLASMMMTDCPWVVQTTDRGDKITVAFQWFQAFTELIILSMLKDLIVQGIYSVGKINEYTSAWRYFFCR